MNQQVPASSLNARMAFAEKLARECGELAVRESAHLAVSSKGAHDVLTQEKQVLQELRRVL